MEPVIAKAAQNLAPPGKPRFIYWLTLNTHIPVAPGDAHTDFHCEGERIRSNSTVCRMAELWHDFFASLSQLALDPRVGPADILVVGDHAPPLWSKRGRNMFAPGKVAWYRLSPRTDVSTRVAAAGRKALLQVSGALKPLYSKRKIGRQERFVAGAVHRVASLKALACGAHLAGARLNIPMRSLTM